MTTESVAVIQRDHRFAHDAGRRVGAGVPGRMPRARGAPVGASGCAGTDLRPHQPVCHAGMRGLAGGIRRNG